MATTIKMRVYDLCAHGGIVHLRKIKMALPEVTGDTLKAQLSRLVADKKLAHVGRGLYRWRAGEPRPEDGRGENFRRQKPLAPIATMPLVRL